MDASIQKLYKYRAINAHTLRTISHSEVYFPLPAEFNDPFDCNIIPDVKFTEGDAEKFVRATGFAQSNLPVGNLVEYLRSTGSDTMRKSMFKDVQQFTKGLRLCCFSEIPNSVMMFSHYAAGHRGICLELSVSDDEFFDLLRPVQYPVSFPSINPFQLYPYKPFDKEVMWSVVEAEFLSKSPDWSYEKEWRILKADAESSIY